MASSTNLGADLIFRKWLKLLPRATAKCRICSCPVPWAPANFNWNIKILLQDENLLTLEKSSAKCSIVLLFQRLRFIIVKYILSKSKHSEESATLFLSFYTPPACLFQAQDLRKTSAKSSNTFKAKLTKIKQN